MSDLFDTPSAMNRDDSDFFNLRDNIGSLVLFSPTEYVAEMETVNGTKDAVKADVVVFKDGNATEYPDSLVFAGAVIGKLKSYAKRGTGKVLARVGQGEAKRGQSAPYILEVPSDADKKLATDYLTKNVDPFAI